MAEYWPGSICVFETETKSRSTEKNKANILAAVLTAHDGGNKGFIIWPKEKTLSCGTNAGSHEQARLSHLARLGSQSEHKIRFILPARTFGHIINIIIKN